MRHGERRLEERKSYAISPGRDLVPGPLRSPLPESPGSPLLRSSDPLAPKELSQGCSNVCLAPSPLP